MSEQNQLAPMQEFEQKVKARLVKDIGDLIPDEALQEPVQKAMNNAFFQERVVTVRGEYGRTRKETKPPVFEVQVKALLREQVKGCIESWLQDNTEEVQKQIKRTMEQEMMKSVAGTLSDIFSPSYDMFRSQIIRDLATVMPNLDTNRLGV